jgi:hypothetical protein
MPRAARKTELRYVVAKDYYQDGDNLRDEFPVLFGTEAEAAAMKAMLEAGSDKSFFDASDEDEAAVLFIDTFELEV